LASSQRREDLLAVRREGDVVVVTRPAENQADCEPHEFRRHGWRVWLCTHCYAPRSLHPRHGWTRSRPYGDNRYLSADAPHFKEGW
jgi:hypothetical protein